MVDAWCHPILARGGASGNVGRIRPKLTQYAYCDTIYIASNIPTHINMMSDIHPTYSVGLS